MRVGVERDHVSDGGGHVGPPAPRREERRVVRAPQEVVQLVELPALALPSHPLAFRLIPDAPAMEQEEALAAVGRAAVAPVEARDPVDGGREEPIILRHGLGGRVGPVGQEREVDVTVRIGEVVDLEPTDMLLDLGLAGEEGGHHDERSQARRDAVAQLEARQRPRAELVGDGAIDERDREVGGRDEGDQTEQGERERTHPPRVGKEQRERQEERGDDAEGPEVARGRPRDVGAQKPLLERDTVADRLLEERQPVRDEVVRGILGAALREARRAAVPPRPASPGRSPPASPRARIGGSLARAPRWRGGNGRGSRSPWRRSHCRRAAPRR